MFIEVPLKTPTRLGGIIVKSICSESGRKVVQTLAVIPNTLLNLGVKRTWYPMQCSNIYFNFNKIMILKIV